MSPCPTCGRASTRGTIANGSPTARVRDVLGYVFIKVASLKLLVLAEYPDMSPKQVDNALAALTRTGQLERQGYGRVRIYSRRRHLLRRRAVRSQAALYGNPCQTKKTRRVGPIDRRSS